MPPPPAPPPPRLIASDCERTNETALPQVFQLISGPLMQQLLSRKTKHLGQLLAETKLAAWFIYQIGLLYDVERASREQKARPALREAMRV